MTDARRELVACVGVLILATAIMLPAFIQGFPAGFDAVRHYRWTSQFIDALRDGAVYPRWLPAANNGQGSPVPLYYAPLPFYVGAGFSLLTGNTLRAITLSCWLALALSGLTMYLFSRSVLSVGLSFAAAALYMLAPYHLLDLYQGATVSEFWAFAWPPLLFYAIGRKNAGHTLRGIAVLALGYALLILTHVPVAFLTTFALAVYAIALTRKPFTLVRIAAGLALGAGIGAIFLLPVLFETRYVWLFFKFDYRDYFLFEHLRAALGSTRFPVNASLFSYLLDTDFVAVGPMLLFLVSSFLIWIGIRKRAERMTRVSVAIWIVTLFSFLMTTRLTAPIWRITPGLSFLFYPWRWLVVASAGAAFFAALSIRELSLNGRWRVLKALALTSAVILNVAISGLLIARAPHDPEGLEGGLYRRDTREYRPLWWDGQLREDLWRSPARLVSGDAQVVSLDETGFEQRYSVTATTESVVAFRPLYFPGWVARLDGSQTAIAPTPEGNIQLTVEPGEHNLTLSFEDTWPRSLGKLVSGVSFALFLGILYFAGIAPNYTKPGEHIPK
ncbi:MAG TPA: 6-pyruvoyl-tetrahydropterin synthase-related protein [Blastocatellia bacterium]